MTALRVVEVIGQEPVSLEDIKNYLRVDITDDDVLISNLIKTARDYVERITNRSIVTKKYEYILDAFPNGYIQLPRPPLISVEQVVYKTADGVEKVFTDYITDSESEPARIIAPNGWPSESLYPVNAVKVTYQAGYSQMPESLKHAIYMLVAHWYENRQPFIATERIGKEVEFAVNALLYPFRVF